MSSNPPAAGAAASPATESPWSKTAPLQPIPPPNISADYRLVPGPPSIPAYLRLRQTPGLSAKTPEQAAAGINGAWCAAHIDHLPSGETVAMCRVIGDGGWYFHVLDLAVTESHQRQGLGAAVLGTCLAEIRERAPPQAFVTLMADPPGRRLYEKLGFKYSSPVSDGMVMRVS